MNIGYKCRDCGNISQKAREKTINKNKVKVCAVCSGLVDPWERPLNERPGYCSNCSGAKFALLIVDHYLIRRCKNCGHEINTDKNNEIVKEGKFQNGNTKD